MSLELEHLVKRYGEKAVVDDVSLSIGPGELFVLLGPSGSGKSTLLRMVAGLAEVEHGRIQLHGRDLTSVPPKDREIGFVFQNYALFQHMTVAANIEFALRVRRVPPRRRRERREELLQLVGLSGFADRYPRQLSGGQQQRVALARALAQEPKLLLLDEPFGALDVRIRVELRRALRQIQRELGLTMIFVTHDQDEAFELADRLAVLRDGRLLEVGRPQELYLRPRSPFVAAFLGGANLFVCPSTTRGIRLGPVELALETETLAGRTPRRMQVLFRPEDVEVAKDAKGDSPRLGVGTIEERTPIGGFERLRVRLPRLEAVRAVSPTVPFGADYLWVDALRTQFEAARAPLTPGDRVWVAVRRFHALAPANLRLLIDAGESPPARAAAELGQRIAERVDAHTSVIESSLARRSLGDGQVDEVPLGAETETAGEGFDIAVLGLEPRKLDGRADWIHHVRHHLLLVPEACRLPSRLLVCVSPSETSKAEIVFAERFAWQLGAAVTLMALLPGEVDASNIPPHVARFMDACFRALSARGVVTRQRVRSGQNREAVLAEIEDGGHDLLVVGSPLDIVHGDEGSATRLLKNLLEHPPPCPLLVVRR